MTYSKVPCPHCGRLIEVGPRAQAGWAWCFRCQAPCHGKYPCTERCPKAPGRFSISKQQDDIEEHMNR